MQTDRKSRFSPAERLAEPLASERRGPEETAAQQMRRSLARLRFALPPGIAASGLDCFFVGEERSRGGENGFPRMQEHFLYSLKPGADAPGFNLRTNLYADRKTVSPQPSDLRSPGQRAAWTRGNSSATDEMQLSEAAFCAAPWDRRERS